MFKLNNLLINYSLEAPDIEGGAVSDRKHGNPGQKIEAFHEKQTNDKPVTSQPETSTARIGFNEYEYDLYKVTAQYEEYEYFEDDNIDNQETLSILEAADQISNNLEDSQGNLNSMCWVVLTGLTS